MLDEALDAGRRSSRPVAHRNCDSEVEQHANDAYALRRNPEQPVFSNIFPEWRTCPLQKQPLVELDIAVGEEEPSQHARDRAFLVDAFEKDAKQYRREQRRGGETKRKRNDLRDPPWRIEAEIAGDHNCGNRRNTSCQ